MEPRERSFHVPPEPVVQEFLLRHHPRFELKKNMFKTLQLSTFAAIVLTCSVGFGQGFTSLAPSDLGLGAGAGPVNQVFDISGLLGEAANSVTVTIGNGHVSATNDLFTVSETESTTYTFGGTKQVEGFYQHGANLGSDNFASGSQSRDGIVAASGETWTFLTSLDSDYTDGRIGSTYFVDYTGSETDQLESNSSGFRWASDQAISSVTVFSDNTLELNNNYSIGLRVISAIPEPTSGVFATLALGMFLVRRKRS